VRLARSLTVSSAAGLVLAVAAGAMLLSHLPAAFHALRSEANAARGENTLGGALSAAAGAGLNKKFVQHAVALIPRHARYEVALPSNLTQAEQDYGVNPITFAAAPTLLQNFLLPRRKVKTAVGGEYVLCYYCDTHWHHRMHWIWDNHNGARVGYLPH
jgi:hypothetical protein